MITVKDGTLKITEQTVRELMASIKQAIVLSLLPIKALTSQRHAGMERGSHSGMPMVTNLPTLHIPERIHLSSTGYRTH